MNDRLANPARRLRQAAVGAGLALTLLSPIVSAQEPSPSPDVPGASECRVQAVAIADLLGATGAADPNSPLFATQPLAEDSLPDGPAVTDEELAAITDTTRQLVACANAFDPFRILALISDRYIGQLASAALAAQDQPALAEQLLLRFPVPLGAVDGAAPVGMIPIRDARLLPDGRIGAILEASIASATGDNTMALFYVAFIDQNGRWLVDEVTPVASDLFGTPAATPHAMTGD